MGNKQFKQYTINTLEDACLVLKSLIVPVIIDLDKYRRYAQEAENILLKYSAEDSISAEIYDSVHDKLLYQQRELLRFIADHQSSSFSYIDVRPIFEKKGYLKRALNESCRKTLNELLDIRNWSFHNAQSMMVADLKIAKKSIPPELENIAQIKPMLNPVVIRKTKSYSVSMLADFVRHNKTRLLQFESILTEMKEDYQEMYSSLPAENLIMTSIGLSDKVQYVDQDVYDVNPKSAGSDIASLSMGIQKREA